MATTQPGIGKPLLKRADPYIVLSDVAPSGVGGVQRITVAAGAASGVSAISVPDIRADDIVQTILEFTGASGVAVVDRSSNLTDIGAADSTIGLDVDTSGSQLLVVWLEQDPGDTRGLSTPTQKQPQVT